MPGTVPVTQHLVMRTPCPVDISEAVRIMAGWLSQTRSGIMVSDDLLILSVPDSAAGEAADGSEGDVAGGEVDLHTTGNCALGVMDAETDK